MEPAAKQLVGSASLEAIIDDAIRAAHKHKAAGCYTDAALGATTIHAAPLLGGETEWCIERAGTYGPRMVRSADGADRAA